MHLKKLFRKKLTRKIITNPITIILLFYSLYFIFFWKGRILFTPDFGKSDTFHINYSYKYFLSLSLKKNIFPFWTDQLHNGLPLLGESQIGSLYLINLLVLKLFNFQLAYSLLFILPMIINSIGLYLLLHELKVEKYLSLIMSLTSTFIFPLSMRWVHLNAIQAYYLTPFLFFITFRLIKNLSLKLSLILALFIQQIILAGHLPSTFVVLISYILFFMLYIKFNPLKNKKKFFLSLSSTFALGITLSLPGLIPIYKFSLFVEGFNSKDYEFATSFPYTPKNIPEFFFPYINGNPKFGTYPPFNPDTWSTFWENASYPGALLSFIIILAIIYLLTTLQIFKKRIYLVSLVSAGILFLLALGKFSPLYFVFNFPPFYFFRTPGRYLVGMEFILFILVAVFINNLAKKHKLLKTIFIFILLANFIELLLRVHNYHLWINSNERDKYLKIHKIIEDNSKIISFFAEKKWNEVFKKYGWQSEEEKESYLFLLNSLYPNSGLVYNKKNLTINTGGLKSNRLGLIYSLLKIITNKNDCLALENITFLLNIKYIITPLSINCPQISEIKQLSFKKGKHNLNLNIYKNKNATRKKIYSPDNYKTVNYLDDLIANIKKEKLYENNVALIENKQNPEDAKNYVKIKKLNIQKNKYFIEVETTKNGIIIVDELLTPEWEAFVDNKKTQIFRANLTQSYIKIPKGAKNVVIKYSPKDFLLGVKLGIILSSSLTALLYFLNKKN